MTVTFKSLFSDAARHNAALKRKAGKHRHKAEEVGTLGPVNGVCERVMYWCKFCHRNMASRTRFKVTNGN